MKLLITGGAGFLGSRLANRLYSLGHEVRVLDDLSSGHEAYLQKGIFFTKGDVSNIPLLWSLLDEIDCVYHLAARVSVAQSILYPREYNVTNVGGSVSLMEAMRAKRIKRVIFASSGAIYGKQEVQPVLETAVCQPDSPYAVSKWAAEQYIHTIGRLWGIETVAIRIFNAYGPNQAMPTSHAPVVPRFLQQLLTGGSVVIFGDGEQTRDFIYVDDVIKGLVLAMDAADINQKVLNIGSGIETSLNQLVALLQEVAGRKVNCVYNQQKGGGVDRLMANIAASRKSLGFIPEISLKRGLEKMLVEDKRFNRL